MRLFITKLTSFRIEPEPLEGFAKRVYFLLKINVNRKWRYHITWTVNNECYSIGDTFYSFGLHFRITDISTPLKPYKQITAKSELTSIIVSKEQFTGHEISLEIHI